MFDRETNRLRHMMECRYAVSHGRERAWFAQFGSGSKCVSNALDYKQLRRLGLTHAEAFVFDEDGFIVTKVFEKMNSREVARTSDAWCLVLTARLPDGSWVGGHNFGSRSSGDLYTPHIFCVRFGSEREAIFAEIMHVLESIGDGHNGYEKGLLPQLRKAAFEYRQMELFPQ